MKKQTKTKQVNAMFARVIEHFGTQGALAEELGSTQQWVSNVLNCKVELSLRCAMKIEKVTKGKFTLRMLMSEKQKCYLKNNNT